jgi:hypothetical protein
MEQVDIRKGGDCGSRDMKDMDVSNAMTDREEWKKTCYTDSNELGKEQEEEA